MWVLDNLLGGGKGIELFFVGNRPLFTHHRRNKREQYFGIPQRNGIRKAVSKLNRVVTIQVKSYYTEKTLRFSERKAEIVKFVSPRLRVSAPLR